ncbi:DUF397 domain-containing protein [Streptomyces bacillaris]|uniref:DUF397 domain-containing protein n=1 Tax=Streptomyces bacillaris TaxID=68179 RepID=UPI00384FA308
MRCAENETRGTHHDQRRPHHRRPVRQGHRQRSAGQLRGGGPLSDGGRAVRDSKDQHGPRLHFGPAQWTAFTDGVKGEAYGS